jgi:hypothetical protein
MRTLSEISLRVQVVLTVSRLGPRGRGRRVSSGTSRASATRTAVGAALAAGNLAGRAISVPITVGTARAAGRGFGPEPVWRRLGGPAPSSRKSAWGTAPHCCANPASVPPRTAKNRDRIWHVLPCTTIDRKTTYQYVLGVILAHDGTYWYVQVRTGMRQNHTQYVPPCTIEEYMAVHTGMYQYVPP